MSQNPPYGMRGMHGSSDGDEVLQRPRRPKPETQARLLQGEPSAGQSKSTMKNSQLSASAPEFVPKTFQQYPGNQPPPTYLQPPLLLSAGAAEFVPRTDFAPAHTNVPPNLGPPPLQMPPQEDAMVSSFNQMNLGPQMDPVAAYLLSEFSKTMVMLTTLPANIRDFLSPLCDKLQQAGTPEILHAVIDILYEQSIYEPNFRYTGARVCHFMCNELKNHPIFGQFKSNFLKKCQQDYNQREELLRSGEEGLPTLCGLTLFMGELFLNVTADASGQVRLEFLPMVLTDLVLTLLSQPSDTSVKTACQLLKLAGGPTEDAMAHNEPHVRENFSSIFTTLNSILSMPNISQSIKGLVKSVLSLQQSNWGRPDGRSQQAGDSHHSSTVPAPDFVQSEPVFYNQYGKPISREEAGYHEEEEENYEDYVLTEEEEQEFLKFQEELESQNEGLPSGPANHSGIPGAIPGRIPGVPGGQHNYGDSSGYQQWSTTENNYDYGHYSQNYDYSYSPYEDDGLTMDDEAEKAFDEFLSSQRGPPKGQ